ncbi:MAG TPA: hypothetical protein VE398_16075 [Acidobacteriota bacterium]|nr:hypothetical protein [Acidobacteriota bacterium]
MGASAGFALGTQIGAIGGPLGMAIGAAVGALAGSLVGLFGGGALARQREAEHRAAVQAGYMAESLQSQTYTTGFGYEGNVDIERGLMGNLQARRAVTVNINNPQFLDASGVEKIAPSLQKAMSRWLFTGGNSLSDDIAWAGGRL